MLRFLHNQITSRRHIATSSLLILCQLPLAGCSAYIKGSGYTVESKEDFKFHCGPIQYIRGTSISRHRTVFIGPIIPLFPSFNRGHGFLQISIEPVAMADAHQCPIVTVNGNEFSHQRYHSESAACGYEFKGLELTKESLMVAIENKKIGCNFGETEYKYYEYNSYIPPGFLTL